MDTQIKKQIKVLAIYQIIGGLLGIGITIWVMFRGESILTQQVLRISLFAAGLYVFSILCGRMLFRNVQRGLMLSIINQVLQVVYFTFGAYGFQYVSGLRIGLGFDMIGSWTFKFRIALSSFQFDLGADTGQKFIGVNLIALFLIFWIEKMQEKVRQKAIR
ncbi:hypothetical protein ACFSKU_20365 [Pontibacter silvestris]|uniref:Uncharacterized protein n=1 Tax=Pontibacter silvestris TaxID=2305183 RepID=A0ABW4X4X6_9BACT|nr:hypothetical protein [Pontibacter silvestris]MCC9137059.1 hypothetical protein [Pontibacter silvestris]